MNQKTKSELDALLDAYEKRRTEQANRTAEVIRQEGIFLSEFKRLREDVIRLAIEKIASELKARGQKCEISEAEDPPGISMNLSPGGRPCTLSFVAVAHREKVIRHADNLLGSQQLDLREFSLQGVNGDTVEKEILGFLKVAFGS